VSLVHFFTSGIPYPPSHSDSILRLVIMKLLSALALALLPFVLANPVAEPEPVAEAAEGRANEPAAILAGDSASLMKRQSCSVSGSGGLNVIHQTL
jgi:hypothetical protein